MATCNCTGACRKGKGYRGDCASDLINDAFDRFNDKWGYFSKVPFEYSSIAFSYKPTLNINRDQARTMLEEPLTPELLQDWALKYFIPLLKDIAK